MAEQYHYWLSHMSPLERLWWEFYNPSVLSCSGNYVGFPYGKILFIFLLVLVFMFVFRRYFLKVEDKKVD